MEPNFVRADIVLIASPHNPLLITPDMIQREKLLFNEKLNVLQSIQNPGFSFIDYDLFTVMVDIQRLQITSKNNEDENLKSIIHFVKKYLSLFTTLSYNAMGINFDWMKNYSSNEVFPVIEPNSQLQEFLPIELKDHELYYGNIIYAKNNDYLLRLSIEQIRKPSFQIWYHYNFHHELINLDLSKILEYLENYQSLYFLSQNISIKLY
ncbi:MAG: hypothetical protein GX428_00020 [Candidatus Atribacteria bacterium]|nr:hypothetical protein [Candidatus Atribacteria bacterium]